MKNLIKIIGPKRLMALAAILCFPTGARAALYIDFENPPYTNNALLGGQNTWTAGEQWYVNNASTPPLSGSSSAYVYSNYSGQATYSLSGETVANGTVFSALIQANNPTIYGFDAGSTSAAIYIRNTGNLPYVGVWLSTDLNFYYLNVGSTEWVATSLPTASYGDILSLATTLDFTTNTFDLVVTNLTTSDSVTVNDIGFSFSTTDLTGAGAISLSGMAGVYDNLSLQAVPEASTYGLIAAGLLGMVFSRRFRGSATNLANI